MISQTMNNKSTNNTLARIGVVIALLVSLFSCKEDADNRMNKIASKPDSEVTETDTVVEEKEKPRPVVTYHLDSLGNKEAIDSFKTRYSEEQRRVIYALNRMDSRRLNAGDKLLIPDSVTTDLLPYAPFPPKLDILDSIPKTVLISRRVQGVALYENGKLVKWGPASTGKESTQTPTGLFYGNYKAKRKISTIDQDWIMPYYFNFMNYEGIGTHEYSLPGYPASHGCVRLRNEEAVYIYNWAKQWNLDSKGQIVMENGTPFLVFGDYDFNRPSPWLEQAKNAEANFLTPEEMQTLKDYVEHYKENPKNFKQNKDPKGEINLPAKDDLETAP